MKLKFVILFLILLFATSLFVAVPLYQNYQRTISEDPSVWASHIEAFRDNDKLYIAPENIIVFVGSSSIRLWQNLSSSISSRPVLNRGFGGARIADVEHYIDDIVFKYEPEMVVLYLGVVDIALEDESETGSALNSLNSLCLKIRNGLPDTKLSVIALRPSPYRDADLDAYEKFNNGIKEMAEADSYVYYIDPNNSVRSESGVLRKDIYGYDRQHLNELGYSLWGNEIEKLVAEILGEK